MSNNQDNGNTELMREAAELAMFYISQLPEAHSIAYVKNGHAKMMFSCDVRNKIAKALAEPPRNCDRFMNELDAQLAFLNEVLLISVDRETMLERDKYENWSDEMRTRYGRWLLALVEEQKGKEV